MIKKFLSLGLLAIFLTYYASITLFSHSHIINGVTIVHSHPYNKGSDNKTNHQHSEENIVLIQLLSHFFTPEIAGLISIGVILSLLYKITADPKEENPLIPSVHGIYSLRAPPVHFIIG